MAYSSGDSDLSDNASRMTLLSTAQHFARASRRNPRCASRSDRRRGALTAAAIALVAYLLWPTWGTDPAHGPERLPVSVGGTLFNVPTAAIRRKIQRHSGPQERVDLAFTFPRWSRRKRRSMSAPTRSTNSRSRSTASSSRSRRIATRWRPTCACARSIRAISSRASTQVEDGLTLRAFKDGSPYRQ